MTTTTIRHKRALALIVGLAAACWVSLAWLVFQLNVGDYDNFWFPGRILAYILLLLAPSLTFVPLGRTLGLSFFGYWTVLSWAVFGFTLVFVPSNPQAGPGQNLLPLVILLVSLFAVLLSVFMPFCYAIGLRVFRKRLSRYDFGRAWREAFLLAGYVMLMAVLRMIGDLTGLTALLLFLILVVVELLFLARTR